jgi:hypothetical protein
MQISIIFALIGAAVAINAAAKDVKENSNYKNVHKHSAADVEERSKVGRFWLNFL